MKNFLAQKSIPIEFFQKGVEKKSVKVKRKITTLVINAFLVFSLIQVLSISQFITDTKMLSLYNFDTQHEFMSYSKHQADFDIYSSTLTNMIYGNNLEDYNTAQSIIYSILNYQQFPLEFVSHRNKNVIIDLTTEQKKELVNLSLNHDFNYYAQFSDNYQKLKDNCGLLGYNSNVFLSCYILKGDSLSQELTGYKNQISTYKNLIKNIATKQGLVNQTI